MFYYLFSLFILRDLNQFKFVRQSYNVALFKIRWIDLFELNKFVNFYQRYDPPSMCSKHVNGFPTAHDHIVNENVTCCVLQRDVVINTQRYVFVFGDFVFVNSSNTHHYKTQISHVLRFSFFVVVKKTKIIQNYMFSVCFSIFLFFYLCSVRYRCLPSAIWLSPGECVWAINDLCLLQYI